MALEEIYGSEAASIFENLERQREALVSLKPQLLRAGECLREAIAAGHKALFFGNGGSAADAQHWAAELSGRYVKERRAMAGLALTTDTSAITAIANDYGFERIFERQVEALANPGDVAIGISTSGRSPNVLKGLIKAKEIGCKTIAVLGRDGGNIAPLCDVAIVYAAKETPRIQEFHAVIGHLLCAMVDGA
jgi:D-sedoheptulose 7-phosphate isomerase